MSWANKEAFFKAKPKETKMTIDGIGDIKVRGLTCGEKDDYEDDVFKVKAGERNVRIQNARAVLIQRCVYNQHGARLFAESDIGMIRKIPADITDPIYDEAKRLSGFLTGDKDEIDELVKNSLKLQDSDSSTDSQDTSAAP